MKPSSRLLAACVLALPLVLAACGGDDDDADPGTPADNGTAIEGDASPGADGDATTEPATPTPERAVATPTPFDDEDPIINVMAGETNFQPTRAEFEALPQSDVTADGEQYSGVSLSDLAASVGVTGGFVEIEGIRSDGQRFAVIRLALEEVGADSLLVWDGDRGYLNLVGATLEPAQWITAVNSITFV